MTDLFYGGEIGSVTPSSGGVGEVLAAGGSSGVTILPYDAANARCAIYIASHTSYAESPTFAGQAEIWIGWKEAHSQGIFGPTSLFELMAGATAQARLLHSGTSITLQYNNGGTWTTIGSTVTIPLDTLNTLSVHLKISTDELELYSSGTRLAYNTGGGDLSGLSNITSCRWYGVANFPTYISELIGSTISTIGATIKTRYASGAGASTAWTGTYADIDEIAYSDTDGIVATAANDIELFTHSGPSLTGLIIRGVGIGIRGKLGSSGATGIQGALRIGSTNYFSSTVVQNAGYSATTPVWETSPATAVAFDAAEVAALQYGVKAIA